jgi:branched-chain amino acid transport system substrate-binding protein
MKKEKKWLFANFKSQKEDIYMDQKKRKNMTRRDFMKKVGTGAAAVTLTSMAPRIVKPVRAAARDYILIGRPETSTGPLSGFGEPSPWADNRVLDIFHKKEGGVYIEEYGKKVPIKMMVLDCESSGTKAAEIASRLILHDKVDLMLFYQFSEAIGAVCERNQMPNLVVENPIEIWMSGGPYKWSYHAGISFKAATQSFMNVWEEKINETNKTFGILCPNDSDGIAMSKKQTEMLQAKGWKVIDPGRYPSGLQDWTSVIKRLKEGQVEILTGTMASPDFASAWRQMYQQGFVPKICSMGRATLFPSGVNAIGGDLANGLVVDIHWSPEYPFKSALTGETGPQICAAWDKEIKKQWTQVLGFKYGGLEIAIDVFKRARSINKTKILDAIAKTDVETILGRISYNAEHYHIHPIVTGQWVKGKNWPWEPVIINSKDFQVIPVTAKMIFPLPGYKKS